MGRSTATRGEFETAKTPKAYPQHTSKGTTRKQQAIIILPSPPTQLGCPYDPKSLAWGELSPRNGQFPLRKR